MLPAGTIVAHAVLRPWALPSLVLALVVAIAVVLVAASGREPSAPARPVRLPDVAAVGAALAVVVGLARGDLSADKLASGEDPTFLLLLPGLVCFVGAVVATRLLRPLMLLGERLSRRGPIAVRLAFGDIGPSGRGMERSSHVPSSTRERSPTSPANCETSAVLPMPGSPVTTATRPAPRVASPCAAVRTARASWRSRRSTGQP